MAIINKKCIAEPDDICRLAVELGISNATAAVLINRGIDSEEIGRQFLDCDDSVVNDPFLMLGMYEAVDFLTEAIEDKRKITIYDKENNPLLGETKTVTREEGGSIFGGIPNNRITGFSGVSGVGKTYLLLNLAREAILKGYFVIWYDSENAIESKQLNQFNIDPTKFRYEPATSVEEFRTSITQIIDLLIEKKDSGMSIPKVLFVLDSLGGLPSAKEIEDAKSGSDKADMTKTKKIRSLFRIISMKMGLIGATMALSNHVYENTNAYVPTAVQSGGQGLVYGASVILNLSKAKLKEGTDNIQTGIIVTAKPDKNRFCIPHTVKF